VRAPYRLYAVFAARDAPFALSASRSSLIAALAPLPGAAFEEREGTMRDLLYLLLTGALIALLLGYVRVCAALGARTHTGERS
jgi:hypothetical protein